MLVERKWYMPSLSGGNILIFHRDHTLRVEGSGGEDEFEGNGTWSLDGDTLRLRYSFHIVGSSAQPSRIVDECKLIRISSTDLVVSHRYRGERSMATYRVLNR